MAALDADLLEAGGLVGRRDFSRSGIHSIGVMCRNEGVEMVVVKVVRPGAGGRWVASHEPWEQTNGARCPIARTIPIRLLWSPHLLVAARPRAGAAA